MKNTEKKKNQIVNENGTLQDISIKSTRPGLTCPHFRMLFSLLSKNSILSNVSLDLYPNTQDESPIRNKNSADFSKNFNFQTTVKEFKIEYMMNNCSKTS